MLYCWIIQAHYPIIIKKKTYIDNSQPSQIPLSHKTPPAAIAKEKKTITRYPEAHLKVFAAPYVHALVVGADLVEVVAVDGE